MNTNRYIGITDYLCIMLADKLYKLLLSETSLELTDDQKQVLKKIAEFIILPEERIFILRGYAGTGKSTIVSIVAQTLKKLKRTTYLLSPTGRAAKVLSGYAHCPAFTIHKKIYRQKKSKDGFGHFDIGFNKSKSALFIVDEASMIDTETAGNSIFGTGNLFNDLISYIFNDNGNKLLLVGDTAQLPPVKRPKSFALDEKFVERFAFPIDWFTLTTIMRQIENSLIVKNASQIRKLSLDNLESTKLKFLLGSEVITVPNDELIGRLEDSYNSVGQDNTIVITRSNRAAVKYNQGIRNRILWKEEELCVDDQLMVVKNNYFWQIHEAPFNFIANGDIVVIDRIYNYESIYDLRFVNVKIHFLDFPEVQMDTKILLDVLSSNEPALNYEVRKNLYKTIAEDYAYLRTKRKIFEAIRSDPYFNAIEVKYAYAVTCHKSQGGQWKHVYIEQESFNRNPIDADYLKWIYTAITRATEKIFLINFNEVFFVNHN